MKLEIIKSEQEGCYLIKRGEYPEHFAGFAAAGAKWASDAGQAELLTLEELNLVMGLLLKD